MNNLSEQRLVLSCPEGALNVFTQTAFPNPVRSNPAGPRNIIINLSRE